MDIAVIGGGIDDIRADVLVVPVFTGGVGEDALLADLDGRLEGALSAELSAGGVATKLHRITTILALGRLPARLLLLAGAGDRAEWGPKRARTVAGTVVRHLRRAKQPRAALSLPPGDDLAASVAAAVHGAQIANFSTAQYKTGDAEHAGFEELQILVGEPHPELERAAEKARIMGEAANLARSLANEPGNKLTPAVFAERAREVAEASGLRCEVMDEAALEERGYGAILGTARGSAEPPRLVTLRYDGGQGKPLIGLVGKGITFDSGGISIKPADRMHLMKTDMSGAAAVLGAMQAIAQLRPPVSVVGVLCLAENLPGPTAMKPGDILTAASGETIEILNTDAEGRLVLADGLYHARQQGATHLVDVATLTGACVVALGTGTTGVFGSSQPWTDMVLRAAEHTGERMWQLPVGPEYREKMKSDIADIANSGGREGGASTAAAFLQDFAGEVPWVHLDIAGTARNGDDLPYMPKGPTGVAVATLTQLVERVGRERAPG
jgi:leucyl aminopeptidase